MLFCMQLVDFPVCCNLNACNVLKCQRYPKNRFGCIEGNWSTSTDYSREVQIRYRNVTERARSGTTSLCVCRKRYVFQRSDATGWCTLRSSPPSRYDQRACEAGTHSLGESQATKSCGNLTKTSLYPRDTWPELEQKLEHNGFATKFYTTRAS